MDDLDRMYRRLVHNLRAGFPELVNQPFEVASVHQHLIPYRLNRRELGLETAEEYELTLTRLLSGARGLLSGDADMQAALRSELESPNPDLSAFRAFGTAKVTLAEDALRQHDATVHGNHAPEPPAPRPEPRAAEMAGRATVELPAPSPQPPPPPAPSLHPDAAAARAAPTAARPGHMGCRYCGGELPEGRETHFCPHCGQNLGVKQCPACSTELEVDWQYCITCGRQVD